MEPSDLELVELVNRGPPGHREAFEWLYVRHRNFVYRIALRFTRRPEVAQDAMQDAFAAFYARFPGFQLQGRLTTYLYAVARNCALKSLRKTMPSRATLDVPAPNHDFPPEFEPLRQAVDDLPAAQREVLLMRIVDEMSVGEVAIAIGIPTGTVKSRLASALESLRRDPRLRSYFLATNDGFPAIDRTDPP